MSVGWCHTSEGRKVSRVAMCEVRSRKNGQEYYKKKRKKYTGQQQKEINCDEPHLAPNEKTQPIQWTERPTGALVAVNSLWPKFRTTELNGFLVIDPHQNRTQTGQKVRTKTTQVGT